MVPEAWQLSVVVGRALRRLRSTARMLALLVCACAPMVACAAKGGADASAPVADTGGYALRLRVQHPSEQRYELFQISRQGRLGWAGGMDAMEATTKISFERDLTSDEAQAFRDTMAKCPWVEAKPDERGPDKAEPITAVALGLPSGVERTFTLRGEQPQVTTWLKLLKPWVAARHKRTLDRLPEATEVPKGNADAGRKNGG